MSQPTPQIDTRMNLLRFLLSALPIFVGVWGLVHQGIKDVADFYGPNIHYRRIQR